MSKNSTRIDQSLILNPTTAPVSTVDGQLYYDQTENKFKKVENGVVSDLAGAATASASAADTLLSQNFESATLGDFTQFNWNLVTVAPLNGLVSARTTHTNLSFNPLKQVFPVSEKFKNKNVTIKLNVKSTAPFGKVLLAIIDETNLVTLINNDALEVSSDIGGTTVTRSFNVPDNCDSLSYTIIADLVTTGSVITTIDDIELFITDLSSLQNVIVQEPDSYLLASGNAGQTITLGVTNIPFATVLQSQGDAFTFNGSQITASKDGIFSFNATVIFTANIQTRIAIYKNGALLSTSFLLSSTSHEYGLTLSLNKTDVISFRSIDLSATLSNSIAHTLQVSYQGSLKQVTTNPNQKIAIPTSELRMEGASTRGSTDTAIVRFDTVARLKGDAFTIESDALLGTRITMKKAGKLSVSSSMVAASGQAIYISKNQASLTLAPTASEILSADGTDSGSLRASVAWTGDVALGDVIRLSASVAPTANASNNLNLSFQEQEIQVSVSNTLPQFSDNDFLFVGKGNAGQGITSLVTDIPFTNSIDPEGRWNGSQLNIPEDGVYSLEGSIFYTAGADRIHYLYINGVQDIAIAQQATVNVYKVSHEAFFTQGQLLSIRSTGAGTLNSTAPNAHYLSITKAGKPNVTGIDITPFKDNRAKNYIESGHAEAGTTGWNTYADVSATRPVDGTGGTANVTLTTSSLSPLAGTSSFLFTKDAADRRGQGVSYDFTIDASDKARVLKIEFDYLVNSGTFVAGSTSADSDVIAYIYDVTNARVIEPSSIKLFSNSTTIADRFSAYFQTSSNSTSYRLILHVASVSALAYTLKLDDIAVIPSDYVYGTPITDWQAYTPILTGFGAASSIEFQWRRVGSSADIRGKFVTGATTAVEVRATLPSELTSASSSVIPSLSIVGFGGSARIIPDVLQVLIEPSVSYMTFASANSSVSGLVKSSGNQFPGSTVISFFASVPISGWSSSVQMSDSADTRVVSFTGVKTINESVTANVTNVLYTRQTDTHGAWNGTQYVVPTAGDYYVQLSSSTTIIASMFVHVNGTRTKFLNISNSGGWLNGTAMIPNLKSGDLVSIRCAETATVNGNADFAFLSISRISGPSAIAATETIAARYSVAGIAAGSPTAPWNYATRVFDTHNAVTTGASWKFTAPAAGIYRVSASALPSVTSVTPTFYKNGVADAAIGTTSLGGNIVISGSALIQLNAGEFVDLRPDSAANTSGLARADFISIERIGL